MGDKLGLGPEIRQLKLGQSFSNPRANAFHTIRYDFKPASVDINKMASVDIGNNNQVSVTVPHLDGAGIPQTLFKGNQRPYQKECVLIIDRVTGEITLEKLSSNMQVKKTRAEAYKPSGGTSSGSSHNSTNRPSTPVDATTKRSSSKTKVTSGSRRNPTVSLIPKHSPLHASPSHHPSPSHGPPPKAPNSNSNNVERTIIEPAGQSILASLPMIGLDDISEPTATNHKLSPVNTIPSHHEEEENDVGILSDSSSSSSDDSGSSDSDSEPERHEHQNNSTLKAMNGKSPSASASASASAASNNHLSMPDHLLNEDLCLSESATDSD